VASSSWEVKATSIPRSSPLPLSSRKKIASDAPLFERLGILFLSRFPRRVFGRRGLLPAPPQQNAPLLLLSALLFLFEMRT